MVFGVDVVRLASGMRGWFGDGASSAPVSSPTGVYSEDGLYNALTGLGTHEDRNLFTQQVRRIWTDSQLEAAYVDNWLVRKAIDAPCSDVFRNWRQWDGDADAVQKIVALEALLGVRRKFEKAHLLSSVYGGAAIGILKGSESLDGPLLTLGPDGLTGLNVADRTVLQPQAIERDFSSPSYNLPTHYRFSGGHSQMDIHPSRLIRFDGAFDPVDPHRRSDTTAWGVSKVGILLDAATAFMTAHSNMADLVHEAKIDVIGVQGLMEIMALEDGENTIMKRVRTHMRTKSVRHAVVMDADETYDQKQINFAGLPDVLQSFMAAVSAAADIPLTRLVGQSPGGLNATGDGDLANYYDRLRGEQENTIRPKLEQLDEWLLKSAGVPADSVSWSWRPLRQMTEKEQAEIAKMTAEAFKVYVDSTTIDAAALDEIARNMMTSSTIFQGAMSAFDEEATGEEDDDLPPDDDEQDEDEPSEDE